MIGGLLNLMVLPIIFVPCTVEGMMEITIEKPSPCHKIEAHRLEYGILKVFLKREDKLCPQVISKETLRTWRTPIKKIEIYSEGVLWRSVDPPSVYKTDR